MLDPGLDKGRAYSPPAESCVPALPMGLGVEDRSFAFQFLIDLLHEPPAQALAALVGGNTDPADLGRVTFISGQDSCRRNASVALINQEEDGFGIVIIDFWLGGDPLLNDKHLAAQPVGIVKLTRGKILERLGDEAEGRHGRSSAVLYLCSMTEVASRI